MFIPMVDRCFGRLRVLRREGTAVMPCGSVTPLWLCLCDPALGGCGETCVVDGRNLRAGRTRSCGCLRRENARRLGKMRTGRRRRSTTGAAEKRRRT